jgi:hypothetical protein
MVSYLGVGDPQALIAFVKKEYAFIVDKTSIRVHVMYLQALLRHSQFFLPWSTSYQDWPILGFEALPLPLEVDLDQPVLDVCAGRVALLEGGSASDLWIKDVLVKRLRESLDCLA